jgi:hypothetical protein
MRILQASYFCRLRHRQEEEQYAQCHFHPQQKPARPRATTRVEGPSPQRRKLVPRLGPRQPRQASGPRLRQPLLRRRPTESAAHMAAQGPQETLRGATRGDVIKTKDPAESRDNLGHGHALGLLPPNCPGKRFAVLDGLVKSHLEPCRQQDNILHMQGEEWRQKQSLRAGKTPLRPGHPSLGGPSRPDDHGQTLRKGLGPIGRLGVRKGGAPFAPKLSSEKFFHQNSFRASRLCQ